MFAHYMMSKKYPNKRLTIIYRSSSGLATTNNNKCHNRMNNLPSQPFVYSINVQNALSRQARLNKHSLSLFFCPLSSKVLNVPFFRCCVLFLRCICVVIFSMLSIEDLYFLSHHFIIKYHISCPFSSYSSILTAGSPLGTTTNHPAPERKTPPPGRIYCYLTTCPPPEEAREKIMKKKKNKTKK